MRNKPQCQAITLQGAQCEYVAKDEGSSLCPYHEKNTRFLTTSAEVKAPPLANPQGLPCLHYGCKEFAVASASKEAYPYCHPHQLEHRAEWRWCTQGWCYRWAASDANPTCCSTHGGTSYKAGSHLEWAMQPTLLEEARKPAEASKPSAKKAVLKKKGKGTSSSPLCLKEGCEQKALRGLFPVDGKEDQVGPFCVSCEDACAENEWCWCAYGTCVNWAVPDPVNDNGHCGKHGGTSYKGGSHAGHKRTLEPKQEDFGKTTYSVQQEYSAGQDPDAIAAAFAADLATLPKTEASTAQELCPPPTLKDRPHIAKLFGDFLCLVEGCTREALADTFADKTPSAQGPFCSAHRDYRWLWCREKGCARWALRSSGSCSQHGGEDFCKGSHREYGGGAPRVPVAKPPLPADVTAFAPPVLAGSTCPKCHSFGELRCDSPQCNPKSSVMLKRLISVFCPGCGGGLTLAALPCGVGCPCGVFYQIRVRSRTTVTRPDGSKFEEYQLEWLETAPRPYGS